jgi:hypothetical protein
MNTHWKELKAKLDTYNSFENSNDKKSLPRFSMAEEDISLYNVNDDSKIEIRGNLIEENL